MDEPTVNEIPQTINVEMNPDSPILELKPSSDDDLAFEKKKTDDENSLLRSGKTNSISPVSNSTNVNDYITNLFQEKRMIDEEKCPLITRLINEKLISITNRGKDIKITDLFNNNCEIVQNIFIPKNYNGGAAAIVPKLIGKSGSNIRSIEDSTLTSIKVLGKGSLIKEDKEEELMSIFDPANNHLFNDLYLRIVARASVEEAHRRIATALERLLQFFLSEMKDNRIRLAPENHEIFPLFSCGIGRTLHPNYPKTERYSPYNRRSSRRRRR